MAEKTPQQRVFELEAELRGAQSNVTEAVNAAVEGARTELSLLRRQLAEETIARHKAEAFLATLQESHTRLKASHERKRAGLAEAVKLVGQQLATLQQAVGEDV